MTEYDMVVIGGGPGGYTAALYGARAGLCTVVLERSFAGGQIALTHKVDNYPGYEDGIEGPALAEKMRRQAERFGATTKYEEALRVNLDVFPREIETGTESIRGKTVIIATGADPRKLGVPMEQELTGHGVAYCAACDGMFYQGKTVVVVGGGNSAAEDALLLSRIAERVILVHRRNTLRAEKLYDKQLKSQENVEFQWNSVVTELLHGENVTGIRLRNTITGALSTLSCDAVFISVGRKPATEFVKGQIELDPDGYIIAGETTRTNIPGVYAVGDVRTKIVRQVVTAVSDGAVAAHMAAEYLREEKNVSDYIRIASASEIPPQWPR